MSKLAFYCLIDKKTYELPKYLYPHARHKSDPEKYAGLWRFRTEAGGSATALSNHVNGCPERVGAAEATEMVMGLYAKYHPHLIMYEKQQKVSVVTDNLLYQFKEWLELYDDKDAKSWPEVETNCLKMLEQLKDIELCEIRQHQLQKAYMKLAAHPQRKIKKVMRRFFKHILKNDYMPQMVDNPFIPDGKWSLDRKSEKSAETNRLRILKSEVRALIKWSQKNNHAWMADALKISFLLGLRCEDVVQLKWSTYRPLTGELLIEIGKSKHLAKNCIRLIICERTHPEAMQIIKRRFNNRNVVLTPEKTRYGKVVAPPVIEKSDYIFYRRPTLLRASVSKSKTQYTQITNKYYSKRVSEARKAIPAIVEREAKENGYVCLHEIRSLFSRIAAAKKYENNTIRDALAHQSTNKGALENAYLDGTNITPQCLVTLADLEGGEIDDLFQDFGAEDAARKRKKPAKETEANRERT